VDERVGAHGTPAETVGAQGCAPPSRRDAISGVSRQGSRETPLAATVSEAESERVPRSGAEG
jgi:hypothetical protein